jgi:hypothetical protein
MFILDKNEGILSQAPAKYLGKTGILYLTNNRLFFEYMEGLITKKKYRAIEISLEDIISTKAEVGFQKKLLIRAKSRAGFIEFLVNKPDFWEYQIGLHLI